MTLPVKIGGFNPCYVGLWSVRFLPFSGRFGNRCFNPCYVGLWSVSFPLRAVPNIEAGVSILVMLDYGL